MKQLPVLVFPGLDGTNLLLEEFASKAPDSFSVMINELPDKEFDYQQLVEYFSSKLKFNEPCVVIGESFSGPLAVLLAEKFPDQIKCLVLVATFPKSPIPIILKYFPWKVLFLLPMSPLVSRLMVGNAAHLLPTWKKAIKRHKASTLAKRLKNISRVNLTAEISNLKVPVFYLQATRDSLVRANNYATFKRCNSDIKLLKVKGPHFILQACPDLAWAQLADSITSVTAR